MAAGTLPPDSPFFETPDVSAHAAEQWDQRTAVWSVSPEQAWHEAEPAPGLGNEVGDRCRIHEQGVVLIANDGEIQTVLDAAGEDAREGVQSRVYAEVGPIWLDAPVDDRPGGADDAE